MLNVGGFQAQDCGSLSRRAFVRAAAGLPLAGLLSRALGADKSAEIASPASAGRARSVLVVWLWGGPSHLDTFDPKPDAPAEYRGPFATIATRTPGVRYSELLPKLAARSDRCSLVRTNVNFSGDHLEAGSIGLTGAIEGPGGHPPNFGSILARRRRNEPLPPFVSIANGAIGDGRGPMKGFGGGTWGSAYDPFLVTCRDSGKVEIPALELPTGLALERLEDRRELNRSLDELARRVDQPGSSGWDHLTEQAYELVASRDARHAFDLSREPQNVRDAYGQTSFGQSCLLARRLVEARVPYVQVNWSQYVEVLYPFSDYGWDTHADNFELLADWHGPLLDRVLSVLLDDLGERGLLEETLVVALGEFGRTPLINTIGSRDHWHQCYFSLWAGAGVEPGRVLGESDARGEHPLTMPVTPATVGATILDRVGLSSAQRAELRVLESGRVLHELFS